MPKIILESWERKRAKRSKLQRKKEIYAKASVAVKIASTTHKIATTIKNELPCLQDKTLSCKIFISYKILITLSTQQGNRSV